MILLLHLLTRAFNLLSCGFSLLTRGFEPVTRGFQLVTRRFELVTCIFEFVTRISELVTSLFREEISACVVVHTGCVMDACDRVRFIILLQMAGSHSCLSH